VENRKRRLQLRLRFLRSAASWAIAAVVGVFLARARWLPQRHHEPPAWLSGSRPPSHYLVAAICAEAIGLFLFWGEFSGPEPVRWDFWRMRALTFDAGLMIVGVVLLLKVAGL